MGNFSLTADSDSRIFCGIASSRSGIGPENLCHPLSQSDNLITYNLQNLEPNAPGYLYFPALQAVCPCWPWSLTGYLWHFPLFWLLCFHFDITQLYYDFSKCYQLSVEKPKQKLSQLTTNQNKCYHHYCPVRTESLAWSAGKHEWSKWDWFLFCIWLVEMTARVFWSNQRAK